MKTPRKTNPKTDAKTEATATEPNAQSPVEPQAPLILGPDMGAADQAEPEAPDLRSDPLTDPLDVPAAELQPDPAVVPPPAPKPEPAAEPAAEPLVAARELGPAPEPRRRGSFVPALLGGVIAAGLGAGAALYLMPQGWQPATPTAEEIARDAAVQSQLAALTAEIEALKSTPAPDETLSATTEALSRDLSAAKDAQSEALDRLQDIENRLENLESGAGFGGTSGGVEPGTVDAVRAEMEAMRQLIEEQRGAQQEVAAAAAAAEERLAAAEAEAARLAAEAEATATAARARAALSHLRAALESGAPLAPVLADLTAAGLTVPEPLSALPGGVPTLGSLQDSFPEAARKALAASLPVTAGTGTWDRVGAFLQAQTGARSLARARDRPRRGAVTGRSRTDSGRPAGRAGRAGGPARRGPRRDRRMGGAGRRPHRRDRGGRRPRRRNPVRGRR
ncbi:hypothetical protein [Frigidibacter mobilis]|uniref:Inner membrane protein n=1 Tax=Frigidibacter mobilis TaxID=1335048 RepID=A0A159ZAB2_9RHOB|nr:hypothetical protein [Frigidibacter mobilis]AMY71800.1 hypothetical protein AKL17_4589 [Frigidibacter mobilis]